MMRPICRALFRDQHQIAFSGNQLQRCLRDDACLPKTAAGGFPQLCIFGGDRECGVTLDQCD